MNFLFIYLNMRQVIAMVSVFQAAHVSSVADPCLQCLGSTSWFWALSSLWLAISSFKDSGICQGSESCLAGFGFSVKDILSMLVPCACEGVVDSERQDFTIRHPNVCLQNSALGDTGIISEITQADITDFPIFINFLFLICCLSKLRKHSYSLPIFWDQLFCSVVILSLTFGTT